MAGTGTLTVTPGTGQLINTLPPSGQAGGGNSLPVVLDTAVETAPGTAGTLALTVQGSQSGVAIPTAPAAGENHIGEIGGNSTVALATLTRPANTTAYASGQLMANSTTAGSVTPLNFAVARKAGGSGRISRARISSTNAGAVNATFRLHLFKGSAAGVGPTSSVGDGGTFSGSVNGVLGVHVGAFDVLLDKAFSDGAKGIGVPNAGAFITFDVYAGSQSLFAFMECRSSYTPVSGETLTVALEVDRD